MRRIVLAAALVLGIGTAAAAPAAAIVGGYDAPVNPGVVSIWTENPNRNRCNAVLIKPRWALSAAHCLDVLPLAETSVRIGSTDNTTGYFETGVTAFYQHPDYDPDLLEHDLMLIKLDATVPATVQKPATWNIPTVPVGTLGMTSGWGWTCETPGLDCSTWYAGPLQSLGVKVLPDTSCVAEWFPATQLCYESSSGAHAMTCFGDSGTGLFTKAPLTGAWLVRGIVIYDGDDWNEAASCSSAPDGDNGKGVAVDVAPYREWMAGVMDHS